MNLKQIVLGLGVMGATAGVSYLEYNAFTKANTEEEKSYILILGGLVNLAGIIVGTRTVIKGYLAPTPPNPPTNPPARNNFPNNFPPVPRIEADEAEEEYHPHTGAVIRRRARRYRQNP